MESSQNRRKTHKRIPKACDHCRVRKIKCDGHCPCQQCSENSRKCTYNDKVSKRKAHSAVYVAELERENERLRNLLSAPDQDNAQFDPPRPPLEDTLSSSEDEFGDDRSVPLDTMIATTAQLFIDARGKYRYQGHSAGFTLLGYVQDRINNVLRESCGNDGWEPFDVWKAFDRSIPQFQQQSPGRFDALPSKEVAQVLTDIALDDGCCLMSFVHRPTFSRLLDQVYANEFHSSEAEEFLPVLYEALALGSLFMVERETDRATKIATENRSLVYFHRGRDLIDLMSCNDIFTLQAIMFIVMFLQSSARLSACHSYLSVAIASTMRLGIHSSTPLGRADIVKEETRKRIVWELHTMETYVTAMLGLPKLLNREYIHQSLPSEVEVCGDAGTEARAGSNEIDFDLVASNSHTELLLIMSKIIRDIYPVDSSTKGSGGRYQVQYEDVAEIEGSLAKWHTTLPTAVPSQTEHDDLRSKNQIRTQLRLRLAYAHVEMVLYRPFLHHLVRKGSDVAHDFRGYTYGSACIKAAMQVIWLVEHMQNQGLLTGTYWLTVYMTFFASMALFLFSVANDGDPTARYALQAAEKGRSILLVLAESCLMAAEAAESLTFLSPNIARISGVRLSKSTESSLNLHLAQDDSAWSENTADPRETLLAQT